MLGITLGLVDLAEQEGDAGGLIGEVDLVVETTCVDGRLRGRRKRAVGEATAARAASAIAGAPGSSGCQRLFPARPPPLAPGRGRRATAPPRPAWEQFCPGRGGADCGPPDARLNMTAAAFGLPRWIWSRASPGWGTTPISLACRNASSAASMSPILRRTSPSSLKARAANKRLNEPLDGRGSRLLLGLRERAPQSLDLGPVHTAHPGEPVDRLTVAPGRCRLGPLSGALPVGDVCVDRDHQAVDLSRCEGPELTVDRRHGGLLDQAYTAFRITGDASEIPSTASESANRSRSPWRAAKRPASTACAWAVTMSPWLCAMSPWPNSSQPCSAPSGWPSSSLAARWIQPIAVPPSIRSAW